ncbi:c-type cytochrome [Halomonas halodenitrificans]|uniref:c-type cytochrome n=1 Tax=Halomonas halodenitrificans TaxID=28252 RepID=UPI0004819291|nr:c-type cytochrome [Halomonas halodenitrificans]
MTSKRILGGLGLLLGAGLASGQAVAIEGDAERGEAAAGTCVACHQADGGGMNIPGGESWPRLAGLDADYMVKQLHDVKQGSREAPTMMPFVDGLDDQQIADVSAYYSQLPVTDAEGGDVDAEMLARGEQIALRGDWDEYIVSCKSCHGPGNQGVGSTFPGIAGQHAGYIENQLHAWQEGRRANDPQNLMGAIAKRMSDEDISAVAAWLSSQPATDE